jgi:hypothetical protein
VRNRTIDGRKSRGSINVDCDALWPTEIVPRGQSLQFGVPRKRSDAGLRRECSAYVISMLLGASDMVTLTSLRGHKCDRSRNSIQLNLLIRFSKRGFWFWPWWCSSNNFFPGIYLSETIGGRFWAADEILLLPYRSGPRHS